MSNDEQDIIKREYKNKIKEPTENRLKLTCDTRVEAKILGKWKGITNKNTYTKEPFSRPVHGHRPTTAIKKN